METLIGHCAPGAGSRPSTVAESCPILRGNLRLSTLQKAGQNRPDLPVTRWRHWEPPELGGNVAM